jgi:hypothetical protein
VFSDLLSDVNRNRVTEPRNTNKGRHSASTLGAMFKLQEVVFRHADEGSGWQGVVTVEAQFGTTEKQLISIALGDATQFHEDLMTAIGQARALLSEEAGRTEEKAESDSPADNWG